MKTKIYPDKQGVAEAFSEYLADKVKNAETVLHVALSGGSTPKVVFDHLAAHYGDLAWDKVQLYWGDERCVPPEDGQSNYKMTKEHLLHHIEIPEKNIFRIKGENDPEEEAERYGQVLANELPVVNGIARFDLVILGMGDDGHTASVFPENIDLWHSDNYCEVATHPQSGQKRVTITGKVINNAGEVAFLVTGEGKQEKVEIMLRNDEESETYPAGLVDPLSGELVWFLDEAAAGSR